MVIETFLVISVAALDLSVVPGGTRTKDMVVNMELGAEDVKGMDTVCICRMSKLTAAVGLNLFGSVTEIDDGPFHKVHGGIGTLFLIGI